MVIGYGFGVWQPGQVVLAGAPVPPPASLSLSEFTLDRNVFDSGGAFGRNAASIPLSGQADPGAVVQGRAVQAGDGSAHTGWQDLATADAGGAWSGTLPVPRAPHWLRMEVRLKLNSGVRASMSKTCASGHVIAMMGQSELFRAMDITSSAVTYTGPVGDTEQVQMVKGTPSPGGGGNPVQSYSVLPRFFLDATPVSSSHMTHAADLVRKNTQDRVVFIDMAIPGTGRTQLSDDSDPLRRWQDLLAKLDAAGWQDGVRPGVIVDMWTNADGSFALDFLKVFKPFYCGIQEDGSDYVPGTPIPARIFSTNTTKNHVHDHLLFDLTGRGLGLFNETETKVILCHHRYDIAAGNKRNWLVEAGDARIEPVMWEQEILRSQAFPAMLADPDLSRLMTRGTEPLNYENGSSFGGGTIWGDVIHPGQGPDGLSLFARHMAHAGLVGAGILPAQIPEFDGVSFDPAGMYAEFTCSAGPVTSTRRLRGLAEPSPAPGAHWTDILGFEFNGTPVERAEIQPGGAIRVHVPPAHAPADWSRDRFFFGRGGGTGGLLTQADPMNGYWMNYPVVEAASLGVAGLYDDQSMAAGGVALRPMPPASVMAPAAYRAASVHLPPGVYFQAPAGVGSGVSSLRIALRAAFGPTQETVYLLGQENLIILTVNKNLGMRLAFWGGGGLTGAATLPLNPGMRQDFVLTVDLAAQQARLQVDGATVITHGITNGASALIASKDLAVFGYGGATAYGHGGFEFESLRIWQNDLTGSGTPAKVLQASDGAAALNADPWKQGSGLIT